MRPAAATAKAGGWRSVVRGLFHVVAIDPTGILGGVLVVLTCLLLSNLGWAPLSGLPAIFKRFVPEANCAMYRVGTFRMQLCSAMIGFYSVMPTLLLMVVIFILRPLVRRLLDVPARRMLPDARFLVAPLVATAIFTACWASIHFRQARVEGIVAQANFPVVIGLYTYIASRYAGLLRRLLGWFFTWRDRYPVWARFLAALLIPTVYSYTIVGERVAGQAAYKEQVVVIVALIVGYLAMAPRQGDMLADVRQGFRQGMRQAMQRVGVAR